VSALRGLRLVLAVLALGAAVAQGAGIHAHALSEVDLAPHDVMAVGASHGCGPTTHLESATPHRHSACGTCALASTPSSAPAPPVAFATAEPAAVGRSWLSSRPRASTRPLRGPARAPPVA
jgi:hypothetical protein